jgi:hypothetical protein
MDGRNETRKGGREGGRGGGKIPLYIRMLTSKCIMKELQNHHLVAIKVITGIGKTLH